MKKVLFIAFCFPPHPAIGSQRPYRLTKYLPQYGWESIILTHKLQKRAPEGYRVIETDYKDVISSIKTRIFSDSKKTLHEQLGIAISKDIDSPTWKSKLIKLIREVITFPDGKRGWYNFALRAASELLERERVDAIISTSDPVTSHLIARKLKQKYKIPWIADLRDLWTNNPYCYKFEFIKYFEKRLELKTLSDADAIVTVTEPWIDSLKTLHQNKKIFCVTNGYDDEEFPELPSKLTSKFTLTYTGQLYNGKRDPSLLFKVVSQLINEHKINKEAIEIRFYGQKEGWLIEEVNKYNLEGIVNFYGFMPRDKVLEKQRDTQILLLFLWDNKKEENFCPGKVYEYFGARRPIVAIGRSKGVVKRLLEETNSGKCINETTELKKCLYEYYQEFTKFGKIKCHSNGNIENYTYRSIAKRYSGILNNLVMK